MRRDSLLRAAFLALLVLPVLAPLMRAGLPKTHEEISYVTRVLEVVRCWEDGFLSARWFPDLYYGQGYPFLAFYAPLSLVLAALFHMAGFSIVGSLKLVMVIATFLSAAGAYRLAREGLRPTGAFVAAALYTYAPYHLLNAYTRGDIAEYLAMGLLPFALHAVVRLSRKNGPRDIAWVAVTGAAVILSHNILGLFAGVFMVIAAAVTSAMSGTPLRTGTASLVGGACALLLSAFFWAPALHERQWVQIELMTEGSYSVYGQFLGLREVLGLGEVPSTTRLPMRLELGPLSLALLVLAPLVFLRVSRAARIVATVAALLVSVGVFMATRASAAVYERISILRFVQFPWRFLSLASLGAALLGAGVADFVGGRVGAKVRIGGAATLAALSVLLTRGFLPDDYYSPGEVTPDVALATHSTTSRLGEFLPRWVTERGSHPEGFRDGVGVPPNVLLNRVHRGVGRYDFALSTQDHAVVVLQDLYYPGWRATLDGEAIELRPRDGTGNLELTVPPGRHRLQVRLGPTTFRRAAEWVSWFAAGLLALAVAGPALRWQLSKGTPKRPTSARE